MKVSTKLCLSLAFYVSVDATFAQNTNVADSPTGTVISNAGGTDIPYSASILDIRSTNKGVLFPRMSTTNRDAIAAPTAGLLLYNTSTNQFNYHNGSSWQAASLGNQWGVNGSILHHSGQVGVGTSAMTNANTFLTVRGSLGGTNLEGMYVDASSGSGKPFYGYAMAGSSRAYHYYDGNRWALAMDGTDRITVTSGGFVGINLTNPTYRLDVNGQIHTTTSIHTDGAGYISGALNVGGKITGYGTMSIEGSATINDNKGVAYNGNNSTNLRIFRFTTATFYASLGAHGSATANIAFGGGFTSTPFVFVGDIDSTVGTTGELNRVILVLSGCALDTSTGLTTCNAKIINTDNAAVDYNIKWHCVAIGY
jgi:hypothetical protein